MTSVRLIYSPLRQYRGATTCTLCIVISQHVLTVRSLRCLVFSKHKPTCTDILLMYPHFQALVTFKLQVLWFKEPEFFCMSSGSSNSSSCGNSNSSSGSSNISIGSIIGSSNSSSGSNSCCSLRCKKKPFLIVKSLM